MLSGVRICVYLCTRGCACMRECVCLLIRGVRAIRHMRSTTRVHVASEVVPRATTRVHVAVEVVPGLAEFAWRVCCASWSVRMRVRVHALLRVHA
jgi:Holliday junction resolvase